MQLSIQIPSSNFLLYLNVVTVRIILIMSQPIKTLLVMGLRRWLNRENHLLHNLDLSSNPQKHVRS